MKPQTFFEFLNDTPRAQALEVVGISREEQELLREQLGRYAAPPRFFFDQVPIFNDGNITVEKPQRDLPELHDGTVIEGTVRIIE